MRKAFLIVTVVVLIVVIAGAAFAYSYLTNQSQDNNNQPQTPVFGLEDIRDQAMTYVAANHTQTLPKMSAFHWTGSREESGMLGAETYIYTGNDWKVTIEYPVVPNPTYNLAIQYSGDGSFNWTGTYTDGVIAEISCTLPLDTTLTQEQVRDLTLQYIYAYHNETMLYMHDVSWMGGRINHGMMVGSETYNYQSTGWNVTIQYPVVPNPIYKINADYILSGDTPAMMWQGKLQNGTIIQNSYSYHP